MGGRRDSASTVPRPPFRPWAQFALLMFVWLAAFMTGFGAAIGRTPTDALISGVVFGVGMTAGQTWLQLRARRKRHGGCDPSLTREQREAAVAATSKGPVPSDPAVRSEAVRLIRADLDDRLRPRVWGICFGVGAVGAVIGALVASPWWWLVAVALAAMIPVFLVAVPRVERRATQRLAELEP